MTEYFTFNTLALHLLSLVQLRLHLSSLFFALVLDVTNWLLQVPTQNSQRQGSRISFYRHITIRFIRISLLYFAKIIPYSSTAAVILRTHYALHPAQPLYLLYLFPLRPVKCSTS